MPFLFSIIEYCLRRLIVGRIFLSASARLDWRLNGRVVFIKTLLIAAIEFFISLFFFFGFNGGGSGGGVPF